MNLPPHVLLTPAVRAALGEGVLRLQDGDPVQRAQAEEIVTAMSAEDHVLVGGVFIPAEYLVVEAHIGFEGADRDHLTQEQRDVVLAIRPDFTADTDVGLLRRMVIRISHCRPDVTDARTLVREAIRQAG